MNRVLIIETALDKVAYYRSQSIKNSSLLEVFSVDYVYAIKSKDMPDSETLSLDDIGVLGMTLPIPSFQESLILRIRRKLKDYKPELILVYTGYVFQQYLKDYYATIKYFRNTSPDLRFGRFGHGLSSNDYVDPEIFHRSEEVLHIENLFYNAIFGENKS